MRTCVFLQICLLTAFTSRISISHADTLELNTITLQVQRAHLDEVLLKIAWNQVNQPDEVGIWKSTDSCDFFLQSVVQLRDDPTGHLILADKLTKDDTMYYQLTMKDQAGRVHVVASTKYDPIAENRQPVVIQDLVRYDRTAPLTDPHQVPD